MARPDRSRINTRAPGAPGQTGGGDKARAKQLCERYKRALTDRRKVEHLWNEVIDYTMPHRVGTLDSGETDRRTDLIFDETAVVGADELVAQLVDGLTPAFSDIFRMSPGPRFPEALRAPNIQRELDEIQAYLHTVLRQSNFQAEMQEYYYDLIIGTGNLAVWDGGKPGKIEFQAQSLTQLAIDRGPGDSVDGRFRERPVQLRHLKAEWPKATLSAELQQRLKHKDTDSVQVIESFTRDLKRKDTEVWRYEVVVKDTEDVIFADDIEGDGSQPIITTRWSKAPSDLYGRGPLMRVLPAIKTANFLIELTLENAQMAIGSMWLYDDDGVINPDTITMEPGAWIPRRKGSSVEPLTSQGRFDISSMSLEEMRGNIRRGLFLEDYDRGGKTPISASEAVFRKQDNNRRMAAAFGRFQAELIFPLIRRVVHILRKQGAIELPKLDGQEIDLQVVSPLAQAQQFQDVEAFMGWAGAVGQAYGPESVSLLSKQEEVAAWLAQKHGMPAHLVRTQRELAQRMKQVADGMNQLPTDENGAPQIPNLKPRQSL